MNSVCLCGYTRTYGSTLTLSQVKTGTIFDNFVITDDVKEAEDIGNETWGVTKVCCFLFVFASSRFIHSLLALLMQSIYAVTLISGTGEENEAGTG